MSISRTRHLFSYRIRPGAVAALVLMAGFALSAALPVTSAHAATDCTEADQNGCVELSATPAQDTVAVPPNVTLILDDSGSMAWNYMPDSGFLENSETYLVNAANNQVYYDPTLTYLPPPKADSGSYTSYSNIKSVPVNGFDSSSNNANLTWYKETFRHSDRTKYYYQSNGKTYSDYYYRFKFATGPISSAQTVYYVATTSDACVDVINCVLDTDTSGIAAPVGIKAGVNIANWFAYYHTRMLMAKSGLMAAFSGLSANYRFGFGAINNGNKTNLPSGQYTDSYVNIVNVTPFGDGSSSSRKGQFWKWLETMSANSSTPLRRALQSTGEYYRTAQPWETMAGDPNFVAGGDNKEELTCRASYTIFTSDGFWNGSSPSSTLNGAAGSNGTQYTSPDGTVTGQYKAVIPFKGGEVSGGSSLADVAAYYWKNDLRSGVPNLVPASKRDPAFWQHMTTFTMGIGFSPVRKLEDGSVIDIDVPRIFKWADDGGGPESAFAIDGFSWPAPVANQLSTIADLAHAGVVGHGDFFSAKNPQQLAAGFAKAIAQIAERNVAPQPRSQNASVAVTGALSFSSGYNTGDWSGTLEAVEMKPNGRTGEVKWDITSKLDAMPWSDRRVYTAVSTQADECAVAPSTKPSFDKGIAFNAGATGSLDCLQTGGLTTPALATGGNDTVANRINYLLGDDTYEGDTDTPYRARKHKLGAIIRSQPVYVSYAPGGYLDNWPADSPEADAVENDNSYSQFQTDNRDREGTVYIGANDGMLHAFSAPAPDCVQDSTDLTKINCTYAASGGAERWAFVPRAVYANLGNLTDTDFRFRPTVDGTPTTRDVFFGDKGINKWRTILAGGVGVGGRGVYALDITKPSSFNASNVLWEFDSDMEISTTGCATNHGTSCKATDLGYSVPQPYIGRLHNDKWVVLVSNGYFPDCSQPDVPTSEAENGSKANCKAIAAQAPKYSALFVLDAQTGEVLAELKTLTNLDGVSSHGLGPAVLGDYQGDQVDDVAFAGDLMGNLWRFDLSDPSPSSWSVSLAYEGRTQNGKQGVQPITVMPRLFPDPWSSRFLVVFGTGKYMGVGDNSTDIPTQSGYGIREQVGETVTRSELGKQTLTEVAGTDALAGATLRKLTDTSHETADKGWYIDFDIQAAKGERVVVTPAAIFATNNAIFQTLIPGLDNYCDPSTKGSVMLVNAGNGGSDGGVSSLGGGLYVGARVSRVGIGGTLPVVSKMGGGGLIIPVPIDGLDDGTGDNDDDDDGTGPGDDDGVDPGGNIELDSYIWRRRAWSVLKDNQ